jgi:hypothetical protein
MQLSFHRCAAFLIAAWRSDVRPYLPLLALNLLLAFAAGHAAEAAADAAARAGTPQAVLAEFYPWYIGELAKRRVPVAQDRAMMQTYVAADALRDIEWMMNRPNGGKAGLREDYFIRARDFFDDWADHVAVSEVMIDGDTASALVTLGDPAQGVQRLALTLLREGDVWKISRVNEAA